MEEVQVNAAGSTDTANPTDETAPVKTDEKEVKKSGLVITWPSANGGAAADAQTKIPPIPSGGGNFVLIGNTTYRPNGGTTNVGGGGGGGGTGGGGGGGVIVDDFKWKKYEEIEVTLCLDNTPKTGKILFLEA